MTALIVILSILGYMGVATGLGTVWAGQVELIRFRPYPALYPDRWELKGTSERMNRRMLSLLWPVLAPVIIASILNHRSDQRDVVSTKVDAALAKHREEMEQSIAALERDNGIGGSR